MAYFNDPTLILIRFIDPKTFQPSILIKSEKFSVEITVQAMHDRSHANGTTRREEFLKVIEELKNAHV